MLTLRLLRSGLVGLLLAAPTLAAQSREHHFVPYVRAAAFRAGLPDLESTELPSGDLELRLWDGFGLTGIHGLILQRTRGEWRASLVEPRSDGGYTLRHVPDTTSWAARWAEAVNAGILNVDPMAERMDGAVARDGSAVVLELLEAGRYRTAGSDAVDAPCGTDGRRLLAIAEVLLGRDLGYPHL
jgi:hypothetical protein